MRKLALSLVLGLIGINSYAQGYTEEPHKEVLQIALKKLSCSKIVNCGCLMSENHINKAKLVEANNLMIGNFVKYKNEENVVYVKIEKNYLSIKKENNKNVKVNDQEYVMAFYNKESKDLTLDINLIENNKKLDFEKAKHYKYRLEKKEDLMTNEEIVYYFVDNGYKNLYLITIQK